MSAEVVAKKRGRPRKVVVEAVGVEFPEAVKKTTTRAKSTKTAPTATTPAQPKAVKVAKATTTPAAPKPTTSAKGSVITATKSTPLNVELEKKAKEAAKKVISNIQAKVSAPPKKIPAKKAEKVVAVPVPSKPVPIPATKASTAPLPNVTTPPISKPAPAAAASKTTWQAPKFPSPLVASKAPVPETPGSSKILSKVRELSHRSASPQPPTLPLKPVSATPITKPQTIRPMPTEAPKPTKSKPTTAPKIPIAEINKEIVFKISERGGSRPGGSNNLPPNYKKTARNVTMTIVAMPIAIVTSYVLYQRLVLKEEKKSLLPPVLPQAADEKPIVLSTTPPVEKILVNE